ncbi:MAG: 1-(5-phosphoribosyl)-5-[(5-phosphoribosylamino)methylideneamino]imidazole-4-carboxamide isomerase [Pyrinomonadaceae bacterium]
MFEIIPAIDLLDGKCVRLSQGDFSQSTTYSDEPVEAAKRFEAAGLHRLHIVDLDGARSSKLTNLSVLEAISRNTKLSIDFGGGIKTMEDLRSVFDAGAAIACIGSMAVRTPDRFREWVDHFGGEKILLGADVRDGVICVDGWQTVTDTKIIPFLREYSAKGVSQVFVTDIARDGLLSGPSIDLYKQILDELPDLELIASGGVTRMEDIDGLERIGCSGVIVGKALYEGKIALEDLGRRRTGHSAEI